MLWIRKHRPYSIGIDMGDDSVKLVQLEAKDKVVGLVYGGSKRRPADIKAGTVEWQRWAIEAIREIIANGKFKGREVIATMPASEVFVEVMKMPKSKDMKVEDAILSKIKSKLPVEPENTMLKYIPTEDDNVIVLATEREKIDRYLAIYEKASLQIKSIGVWPTTLTNTYASFFGRRKSDLESVVFLIDTESNCTNIVISRHKNLLFVRSIPIGKKQFGDENMITRLNLELAACKRQFNSMYHKAAIERLIFLSGQAVDKEVSMAIAKQLEIPAQIGDCLAAVEIKDPLESGIERRGCDFSWAIAFGLSLAH